MCFLAVPRCLLGVACSSKGLVAGQLVIHDRRNGGWWVGGWVGLGREGKLGLHMCRATTGYHCSKTHVQHRELMFLTYYVCTPPGTEVDCSLGGSGQPITGDINRIKQYNYQSHARCVLVVEKDAIFQVGGAWTLPN